MSMAVRCCVQLEVSQLQIWHLQEFVVPFQKCGVARLWVFFNPFMKIWMEAVLLVKLHLLTYCFELMDVYCERFIFSLLDVHEAQYICMDISMWQSFSIRKSLISSQDMSKVMASIIRVQVNPLDLALARLALLSFVKSAAISISISQSSNYHGIMSMKNRYILE